MPILINNQTNLAENLPDDQALGAVKSNSHSVPMVDPNGDLVNASFEQAKDLLSQGYTQPSPDQINMLLKHAKYSSTPEQVKSFLEGAADSATFGIAPLLERAGGEKKEDILGRAETNPGLNTAGQIGGLAASNFIPGYGEVADEAAAAKAAEAAVKAGTMTAEAAAPLLKAASQKINPLSAQSVLSGAGRKASEALGLGGENASLISRLGAGAVQGGVESGLFQGTDELSKMLSGDPDQTAQSAVANVGLGALLGAAPGAAFGHQSPLWKIGNESKVGQLIEDFKSRIKEHVENPDPVQSLADELAQYHNTITSAADDVYGARGLKTQEINKLLPEQMTTKMSAEPTKVSELVTDVSNKLSSKPSLYPSRYVEILNQALDDFKKTTNSAQSPAEIFNSINELKQTVGKYGDFKGRVTPDNPAFNAVKEINGLYSDLRKSLEDSSVWGKAAERQQTINKAFAEFNPTLKDFQKTFTTEVNGERVIDPGKINTYMNQLGKPNAEIKQAKLDNFLKAAEQYRSTIEASHRNLGLEGPFQHAPLTQAKKSLQELTPGAKMADVVMKKGLARFSGEALGTGVGAGVGHALGSSWLGALVGEHALGPIFTSILPGLVKPLMTKATNPEALKSAIDLSMAASKTLSTMNKGVKSLFDSSREILPTKLISDPKRIKRLDDKLKNLQVQPENMLDVGGRVPHYLPDHGRAMGQLASNATNYLNSLRPNTANQSPLDTQRKPSAIEKAQFERALQVADHPLIVLDRIKQNTLNPKDVVTLKTIYPSLYSQISQKMIEQISEHQANGKSIPYQARLGVGLFLGQPLDSTMTPQSIQAIQASIGGTSESQQPTAQPQGGHGKGSLKALNKLGASYQTNLQSREANLVQKG